MNIAGSLIVIRANKLTPSYLSGKETKTIQQAMATVTFKKDLTVHLSGEMPAVGTTAPNFGATKTNLSEIHLEDLRGQRVVLNIFPSVAQASALPAYAASMPKLLSSTHRRPLCI